MVHVPAGTGKWRAFSPQALFQGAGCQGKAHTRQRTVVLSTVIGRFCCPVEQVPCHSGTEGLFVNNLHNIKLLLEHSSEMNGNGASASLSGMKDRGQCEPKKITTRKANERWKNRKKDNKLLTVRPDEDSSYIGLKQTLLECIPKCCVDREGKDAAVVHIRGGGVR